MIDWNLYKYSAAQSFLDLIHGKYLPYGVFRDPIGEYHSQPWHARYSAKNLLPDGDEWNKIYTDAILFGDGDTAQIAEFDWFFDKAVDKWAKRFDLTYADDIVNFRIEDETGKRYVDLSAEIDWSKWCVNANHSRGWYAIIYDLGIDNADAIEYENGKLVFVPDEGVPTVQLTPAEFIGRVVEAIKKRDDILFKNWYFILQENNDTFRIIRTVDQFKGYFNRRETVEVCQRRLIKGYSYDTEQYEVKITLVDGRALYGVADYDDDEANGYFIRHMLNYKGDIPFSYTGTFDMPVPLVNCDFRNWDE